MGSARILDLGCGNGYVASVVAALGHEVTGLDIDAKAIYIAVASHPMVRFVVGSVDDDQLPARVGKGYDCVIALEVIEHLFNPRQLFAQSVRLLRPDGCLILSTPYHGYLKNLALSVLGRWDRHFTVDWDGGHIKFFSRKTLMAMAMAGGFVVEHWFGVGRVPGIWKSMMVVARRADEDIGYRQ
jgi:2-polyprenyl-6-hydroxyphenyl methylase/3-demethylubiquinone-9 3-methyltransferase